MIGTAHLQVGDASMGHVFGTFVPNAYYDENIREFVWEFWSGGNKPDYKTWESLRLNVQLENGLFLFPFGGYTFEDSPEFPEDPKRIDIAGIDMDVFNFAADPFIEPWTAIDIVQKLAFEDELLREITPPRSFWDFLPLPKAESHVLVGAGVSAFAKYRPSDDVLFCINKNGEPCRFAAVHLTWSRRKRGHDVYFPATHFYLDFNDFEERRMEPDHIDFNS